MSIIVVLCRVYRWDWNKCHCVLDTEVEMGLEQMSLINIEGVFNTDTLWTRIMYTLCTDVEYYTKVLVWD